MSTDRMLTHTDENLRMKFSVGKSYNFDELMRLPCLFMQEGSGSQIARVGRITSLGQSGRLIHFDYIIESGVPALSNRDIYNVSAAFGFDGNLEFNRTHWAIKDVNLYKAVLKASKATRSLPTVFSLKNPESIEPDQLSVMMPFDGTFNSVYNSIKEMSKSIGMRCNRGDDIWSNDSIIQDVVELIDRSKIVICDCSGRNPNVFYEIGIAHTLGRSVILITQSRDDVPFDLRHIRYINYLNNKEGLDALCAALKERINTLVS